MKLALQMWGRGDKLEERRSWPKTDAGQERTINRNRLHEEAGRRKGRQCGDWAKMEACSGKRGRQVTEESQAGV